MMFSTLSALLIILQTALSFHHSNRNGIRLALSHHHSNRNGLALPYSQSSKKGFRLTRTEISSGNFDGYRQPDTKKGAYEIAASAAIAMPCIILVKPFLDQNVGSVSRAMVRLASSAYDFTLLVFLPITALLLMLSLLFFPAQFWTD